MESKIHKYYGRWQDGMVASHAFLQNQNKKPKFLIEQNRNLGDTLHLTPIIRHYRNTFPDSCIVFLCAKNYSNAHEYNPHIDRLFLIPSLKPSARIQMRRQLLALDNIRLIAPSIFPYGEVWKELKWSLPNIADQYLHNAGIVDHKPNGGRKLVVQLTPHDHSWAENFVKKYELERKMTCCLEYHSYSDSPRWRGKHFAQFVSRLAKYKIRCVSLCGSKEKPIPGTISAAGCSWRQAAALLNRVGSFVGVGSGLTMLAASCDQVPHILEMLIPTSIDMKTCGYANSIRIGNPDPVIVADHLWFKVLN